MGVANPELSRLSRIPTEDEGKFLPLDSVTALHLRAARQADLREVQQMKTWIDI